MAKVKAIEPVEEVEEIAQPEPVEEVEEIAQPEPVEVAEEITKSDDIPNITNDFENKLKANANKEKDAPKIKETSTNENFEINNQEDDTNSFNWFLFISGFFLLIVGFVAFLLFKDDNKSIVENEAPAQEGAPFKDFL